MRCGDGYEGGEGLVMAHTGVGTGVVGTGVGTWGS